MATDTIVRVDPKTLLVGPNVRKEVELSNEFVASIKLHGVIVPIVAQETADGLDVVDGQRRTLAAVDAGLTEVPVFVGGKVATDAQRIVEQLVVNNDRESVSRVDQVAAVKQLALDFKMPVTQVAKKLGITKQVVQQAIAIGGSETAIDVMEAKSLTLEQAAKVAAHPELTRDEIDKVLQYGNFDHTLQQILDGHAEIELVAKLRAETEAAGVKVVARPTPAYSSEEKNKHRYLTDLVDKESGERITADSHASCGGHAAAVGKKGGYGYGDGVEVRFVCTDPSKFGHRDANRQAPTPLTDAEKAERAENSAIAKVWPSIVKVRQTWIREQLLLRKVEPAGWEALVGWVKFEVAGTGGTWDWGRFAAKLLGVTEAGYGASSVAKWVESHQAKVGMALLATAIAQIELSAGVSKSWKGWRARMLPEYLGQLQRWGYQLSDVEQGLVDASKAAA